MGGNTRNLYILWVSCYRDRGPVPKETPFFSLGLHPHNYRVRRLHWSRVPTTITLPFFMANSKESRTRSASSWLIVLIPSTADFCLVLCSENGLPTDVLNATSGNQIVLLSEFKTFQFCLSLMSVIPGYFSSSLICISGHLFSSSFFSFLPGRPGTSMCLYFSSAIYTLLLSISLMKELEHWEQTGQMLL